MNKKKFKIYINKQHELTRKWMHALRFKYFIKGNVPGAHV